MGGGQESYHEEVLNCDDVMKQYHSLIVVISGAGAEDTELITSCLIIVLAGRKLPK